VRRALEALASRPALAATLATVYSIVTIAAHEEVNQWVRALQGRLGRDGFAALVWAVSVLLVMAFLLALTRAPRAARASIAVGLALWLVAAAFVYRYLFTVASEGVHFAQYAGLVLLVFPLVGRVAAAMLIANLIGIADEAYQFWGLHPDWGVYLDWNDIVLNALGALLGALLLALAGVRPRRSRRAFGVAFALTLLLLAGGAALVASGRIVLHAGADRAAAAHAWLVLDRGDVASQPFWVTADWAQKRYHVLLPGAGAAAVAAFALLALAVDRRERRANS